MSPRRRQLGQVERRRIDASVPLNFRRGVLALALLAVGVWFAFGGGLPFRDHYEISAVFRSADNVKKRTPVRIAGVQVGEVVEVRHLKPGSQLAQVTMRIEEGGRPIHPDARLAIRPRLFLEGNFFIDLEPGSPGGDELADGAVVPVQQTSGLVPISDILNILDADTRTHIRTLLREYASALRGPGADGYRRSIQHWGEAYRNQAIANEAWLGTEPRDLSRFVNSAGRVARGLDRDREALKSLVTDFDVAAGAFAREAVALEATITELPRTLRAAQPALRSLDRALPAVRRLTSDLRPVVRESDEAMDEGLPYFSELREISSRAGLRGLARDLRPVVPALARLTRRSTPLQGELRLLANCENEVIGPWGRSTVGDPVFPATGPVYTELIKNQPGLSSESRSGDANGQWVRSLTSAGDHTVAVGPDLYAQAFFPILGTNPPKPREAPPLRPDVPCETQEPPDLRSNPGSGEPTVARGLQGADAQRRYERAKRTTVEWARDLLKEQGLPYKVTLEEAKP